MTGFHKRLNRAAVGLLALIVIPSALSAQGVEDFYHDRQIDMIIGGGPVVGQFEI